MRSEEKDGCHYITDKVVSQLTLTCINMHKHQIGGGQITSNKTSKQHQKGFIGLEK